MTIPAASKTHAGLASVAHPARLPAGIASVLSVLSVLLQLFLTARTGC